MNTAAVCRTAHPVGTDTTSVVWSWDGHYIASRATDDTLRLWDLRKLKNGAVHIIRDLPVIFDQTEVCFSPNNSLIMTGVSATRGDSASGRVAVYRKDNFEVIH